MTFRIQAKHVLLTYAQCGDLDPWAVNDHLGQLGAECIVGREEHSDGGVHLHAFVQWERKFESRNQRVFDVDGCHPNIQTVKKTHWKAYDYAIKDGDVVAGGLERPSESTSVSSSGSKWSRALLAETREEFFAIVAEVDPRALCCSFGSLRTYADWRFRPVPDPYESPSGISFDTSDFPELDEWVQQSLVGPVIGKWLTVPDLSARLSRGITSMLGLFANVVFGHAWSRSPCGKPPGRSDRYLSSAYADLFRKT